MMCVMWNFPTMSVQWCVFGVLQRVVSDLAMYDDGRGYNWICLIHTSLVPRLRGKRETQPIYEARFVPTAAELTYRELIAMGLS